MKYFVREKLTSNPKTISTDGPLVVRLIQERLTKKLSMANRQQRRETALKWNTHEIRGLLSICVIIVIRRGSPGPINNTLKCTCTVCTRQALCIVHHTCNHLLHTHNCWYMYIHIMFSPLNSYECYRNIIL